MSQIGDLLRDYPGLEYDEASRLVKGYIEVGEGDQYNVTIDTRVFPTFFPTVIETLDRIPKTNDRHCNTSDGSLCFTTRPKEEILLRTRIRSLLDFVREILVPFLQNNSYYEITGEYYFGEFAHSERVALFQTYSELLGVEDPLIITTVLSELVRGEKLSTNAICYCGSGKKIKKCSGHLSSYSSLRLITRKTLAKGLAAVTEHIARTAHAAASGS